MNDRILKLMAWSQNAVAEGEEGQWSTPGGLLVTILVILLILCALVWLYFNVNVNEK